MFFDIQPEENAIIKVIGVGGGGSNAVNFMYKQGIQGVDFIICNTDQQALNISNVPNKIQLGPTLTGGRGAGAKPEVGKEATLESEEEIKKVLGVNTQMVFITAGMGGGTGTGGAPVIAKIAKDMGILTVGIVTMPFAFEGKKKRDKAQAGIEELSKCVDSLIEISNDKLKEMHSDLSYSVAFSHADNILSTAARGISDIVTKSGAVNVDFEDVKSVMTDSGVAIMGIGVASGEGRAAKAIDEAMNSPLLNDNDIYGAKGILVYISSGGKEVTMNEITQIIEYAQEASGNDTEVIWGIRHDDSLDEEIAVTLIATGFKRKTEKPEVKAQKIVVGSSDNTQVEQKVTQVTNAYPAGTKSVNNSNEIHFEIKNVETEKVENIEPKFTIRQVENTSENPVIPNPIKDRADYNKDFLRRTINNNRFKDEKYIHDMETIPSYQRKNRKFENVLHSSQSHLSSFSVVENKDENDGTTYEIKKNTFLSDKPD